MKLVIAMLGCLLATLSTALCQPISIDLVLDQEQFLPGEPLVVKVRIANFSGQHLVFGKDDNWLTLLVEDARHVMVTSYAPVPVKGEFTLEPSITGTKKVNIAPYFDLVQPGRYYLSAIVNVPGWGRSFQTKQISFDIIKGSNIWDREFGVPHLAGDGADGSPPEIRRFALVQTLHSKNITLYFRLTDTNERKIFAIYPLGAMVSFSTPSAQLDRFSNLHVLYQTSGRFFVHSLINPDGLLIARETYEAGESRPLLRPEADGRISVGGGVRWPSPTDLPPALSSNTPTDVKAGRP